MQKHILTGLHFQVYHEAPTATEAETLNLLSVVIPARNEDACVATTVEELYAELQRQQIRHEIIVVDDGSSDRTWEVLQQLVRNVPTLNPVRNQCLNGFGRAVCCGFDRMIGDAVVIMMADASDDCRDVALYWDELKKGYDCVFGSRFVRGGQVIDYPWPKLLLNRLANTFLMFLFTMPFNDTTNAFKAYRREVIEGCRPFISAQFNLTVEIPLKAIVRGYSWTVMPTVWRNRLNGTAKFRIKEMGSRYLFICLYVWLEKISNNKYLKALYKFAVKNLCILKKRYFQDEKTRIFF